MANLPPLPLPSGVSSNFIDCPSVGLNFHYISAGNASSKLLLLLHGYPELAFSWRKVMPALAAAGYYVVAPDQRGYGRTTGWDTRSWGDVDLGQFTFTTLVKDIVVFVQALGYREVTAVVGHDFGAQSASMCALMRPDMFRRLVLMSHPYKGVPDVPEFGTAKGSSSAQPKPDIPAELAALPVPRKHYRNYNSTSTAAKDWANPAQGMRAYLRGYIHVKSASWARNEPRPLSKWTGTEMARMPWYYIMPLESTMPSVVEDLMKDEDPSTTTSWLSDADLDVYVQEWSRTGFQGALNWYRTKVEIKLATDLLLFAGKKIEVPTVFISGSNDWGNFQEPGALESMSTTCSDFKGIVFVDGAGHWPQQEQPEKVLQGILDFLSKTS